MVDAAGTDISPCNDDGPAGRDLNFLLLARVVSTQLLGVGALLFGTSAVTEDKISATAL